MPTYRGSQCGMPMASASAVRCADIVAPGKFLSVLCLPHLRESMCKEPDCSCPVHISLGSSARTAASSQSVSVGTSHTYRTQRLRLNAERKDQFSSQKTRLKEWRPRLASRSRSVAVAPFRHHTPVSVPLITLVMAESPFTIAD
eukprot:629705-Rhodomonas_salina.3